MNISGYCRYKCWILIFGCQCWLLWQLIKQRQRANSMCQHSQLIHRIDDILQNRKCKRNVIYINIWITVFNYRQTWQIQTQCIRKYCSSPPTVVWTWEIFVKEYVNNIHWKMLKMNFISYWYVLFRKELETQSRVAFSTLNLCDIWRVLYFLYTR